jgi:hypothetical protein
MIPSSHVSNHAEPLMNKALDPTQLAVKKLPPIRENDPSSADWSQEVLYLSLDTTLLGQ